MNPYLKAAGAMVPVLLALAGTARQGFTIADYGNLMRKTREAQPEIARTCGS